LSKSEFGLKDIMEEIDNTFKPLELVSLYIIWKNEVEIGKGEGGLEKELKLFIDSITPTVLGNMIDELTEQGFIKKDKDGNYSLPKNKIKE